MKIQGWESFTYWEELQYNFSLCFTVEYDNSSIVDCHETVLALELVVDLSSMFDATVKPLALPDPLEDGWEVSSVESDLTEVVDDDFMQGLSKND